MIYGKLPIVMLSTLASQADGTTECAIASYILAHAGDSGEWSIARAARECHVSVSSVSRFCRSIGLSDFAELRMLMNGEERRFVPDSGAMEAQTRGEATFRAIRDGLDRLQASVDYGGIERLCRRMDACEDIYLLGLLKAGTAAQCLQADLLLQGRRTICKVPFAQQLDCLRRAGRRDMVVIFSYSGIFFDYLQGAVPDGLRQAYVAFVTGARDVPEHACVDQVISFDSTLDQASHPFQLQAVARLIAQEYAFLHREKA